MMLQVQDVHVSFKKENQKKIFGKERQQVVRGVSFELKEGECLGLIGESGSGKSTLGRVITGLLRPDSGKVLVDGIPLYQRHTKEEKAKLRHSTSIVFQDYTSSVNPRFRVTHIIGEALRAAKLSKQEESIRIAELLDRVGLNESYATRYPHELSGGQLQRVCIARAMAIEPKIILLDEAVSSLDAATQTQVMDLLIELRDRFHFSYVFITHDLTTITYLCDRVLFFYEGQVVERVNDINDLSSIQSEYGRKLLHSVVRMDVPGACAL